MMIGIPSDVRPAGIDPHGLGTLPLEAALAPLIPSGPKLQGMKGRPRHVLSAAGPFAFGAWLMMRGRH